MGPHTYSPDAQAILDAVRHIVQALRESSRQAEQHVGMSGAQLFVLQRLADTPALSINELAARAHTHQSSVSTVVARLVDRGLVRRDRSEQDGRSVRLSLTPLGRKVVRRAPDVAQQRLVQGIERLSPARRRQLAASLRSLANAVATTDRAPAMFFEDGRTRARRRAATRG